MLNNEDYQPISDDDFLNYYFPQGVNLPDRPQKLNQSQDISQSLAVSQDITEAHGDFAVLPTQPDEAPEITLTPNLQPNNKDVLSKIAEIEEKLTELKMFFQGNESIARQTNRSKELNAHNNKVVQGRFYGEWMIGDDGKKYSVPSNYVSKSKLLEGDLLVLNIKPDGRYVYRIVEQVATKRIVVRLEQGADGHYYGVLNDQSWRIVKASVVYRRAKVGDQVILLIPKDKPSKYALIESVI